MMTDRQAPSRSVLMTEFATWRQWHSNFVDFMSRREFHPLNLRLKRFRCTTVSSELHNFEAERINSGNQNPSCLQTNVNCTFWTIPSFRDCQGFFCKKNRCRY